MNKNYEKGKRYEKKEKALWEKTGSYYGVESRGSHGLVDIVLLSLDDKLQTYCIQVKSGRSKPSVNRDESLRTFLQLKVSKNIKKLIVWYHQKNGKGKAKRVVVYEQ